MRPRAAPAPAPTLTATAQDHGLHTVHAADGAGAPRAALGGTALLAVAFLCLLTPTFPWYFLVAAPFTALLGLWSPFALTTGGFLLYGFHADAPGFLARWSVLMGLALLAAARDVRAWRRGEMAHDAR